MMGHRQVDQAVLFYEFSLERHIPTDHLLRSIERFVDLAELRGELASFYSTMGRPSVDPELMIRMLIIGYCFGIRCRFGGSSTRVSIGGMSSRSRSSRGRPQNTPAATRAINRQFVERLYSAVISAERLSPSNEN